MARRVNSWALVLLAAAGAAAIYAGLMWYRMYTDPTLPELLGRLPQKDALTLHVDLAAIRAAGLSNLLEGSAVAEEPDYRRFVEESGFDWKRDLEAVTASRIGRDWFLFVRGQFDMEKLRKFALSRNGICRNGVCDVAGATPGRRVSFFPLTSRLVGVSTSGLNNSVYALVNKKTPWAGVMPEGPLWVSFPGSLLEGDPALPSGGRLFGKVLSETNQTIFSVSGGAGGLELKMRAVCRDAAGAGNVKAQLEGVTKEFKAYFDRLGQTASAGDLSGLLLSGQFEANGNEVNGRWPLHSDLLKKLAEGSL